MCPLVFALLVPGCPDDGRSSSGFGGSLGSLTSDQLTEGGSSNEGGLSGQGDAADGTATGGFKFDLSNAEGGESPPCVEGNCGCNAVDILFVIDSSTSMGAYQQGLAAAAPAFADAIVESLPSGVDLHIGVTTSSFYGGGGGTSPGESNCSPNYEGAGLQGRDDLFQWYWTPHAMPYDENGGQGRLREHAGKTYFAMTTGGDPVAMKEWLSGNISAVGEEGSVWEMVAAGAAYPFHPANAAANGGFLRDAGAVLVIVALTDEVDNSPEAVQTYHDMIVAAKQMCGGDPCVVTAGIMQPCMASAPDNVLYPLLASFGKPPVLADVGPELGDCFKDCESGDIDACEILDPPVSCADLAAGKGTPQYADAVGNALAQVIAQTCETIPPAG